MNPGSDRSGLPGWFSTHPSPEDRVVAVRKEAREWQQKLGMRDPKVNRDVYLRHIDGLVYGDDPRQGYVDEGTFYHPDMKFQFPVPANWKVNNTHIPGPDHEREQGWGNPFLRRNRCVTERRGGEVHPGESSLCACIGSDHSWRFSCTPSCLRCSRTERDDPGRVLFHPEGQIDLLFLMDSPIPRPLTST